MSNSFNEYVKTAPTPPPPPLGLLYTENQNIKNSANLTNEQRLHFDENMERLTYILARVESLIGLAKDNPDILTECGSLMRSAADIDLPSEIKNQKLATCPAVVQEIYKRVTNDGTAQSIGQMAKQQNINMQIQQNFIDSQNEQYISQQHNMAMNALDDAISNNKPITNEIVCKHCAVMSDVTNKEKYDIKYCNQLMQRYLNAATPEERKKVLQEMKGVAKYAHKQWKTREKWHKTTRSSLASGKLTPEQLKEFDESLRKEEETAKQMLKQAQELRQLAENETDPQKRKELLGMASEIE